jgi:hypothetical protein
MVKAVLCRRDLDGIELKAGRVVTVGNILIVVAVKNEEIFVMACKSREIGDAS